MKTDMQADRFICISEVRHLVGLKNSSLYQMIKRGAFPKPIKLGGASRWSLEAVCEWMNERRREAA